MVSAGVPNPRQAACANSAAHRDGYVHEGQSPAARSLAAATHILTVSQEVAKVCLRRPHAAPAPRSHGAAVAVAPDA
jgi:hypothetical protein